jgi:Sulfotransferase family
MSTGFPGFNVSEKYKYLWYAPERTGSRGVASILCFYGFKFEGLITPINSPNEIINNIYFRNYTHRYNQDKKYNDYKVICNTRNPYSRVFSLYKNYANKGTFKDYVYNITNNDYKEPKVRMLQEQIINIIKNPQIQKPPDYILRLEYLGEDIKKIPFIYDILTEKQLNYMIIHGKEIDEWQSFYDSDMKEIVYNVCKHQFDIFGYEK